MPLPVATHPDVQGKGKVAAGPNAAAARFIPVACIDSEADGRREAVIGKDADACVPCRPLSSRRFGTKEERAAMARPEKAEAEHRARAC
ncbi:hypothetical protein GGTG_00056 [Gaeumannomyces tritici R3-111a-1]|uniref:Uncharacterized protein n=1 Tax=Gaeumannomyces tritici (strain R3-111a-1) TaxID=644352 RepID=J3NFL0_GAET3|nr:hypothetical protein GGTG_00056 [Gaeumannomyces tritici R3-111a-1]EJT80050.1 hypothetical protein GGTG_00056 [Gaeumannomyces tritici R3-111a-1]